VPAHQGRLSGSDCQRVTRSFLWRLFEDPFLATSAFLVLGPIVQKTRFSGNLTAPTSSYALSLEPGFCPPPFSSYSLTLSDPWLAVKIPLVSFFIGPVLVPRLAFPPSLLRVVSRSFSCFKASVLDLPPLLSTLVLAVQPEHFLGR